jgi:hypothetical protein
MLRYLNKGTSASPALQIFLNLEGLRDLTVDTIFPIHSLDSETFQRLALDGFEGVQLTDPSGLPSGLDLPFCGLDRISTPAEADAVVARHADRGDICLTVHVGWGLEDDVEAFRLVESVLQASDTYRLPLFVETHRATITQDMWRTVQLTKKFPEIRFNGDFSHYYCGQEMVYGGLERKLDFLAPVFERVGFLHGRIASPGSMQVPIDRDLRVRPLQAHGQVDYLADFRKIWVHAMRGFLRSAGPGDVLIFAPELLSGEYYYARLFPGAEGKLVEECDRYAQALLYRKLALECFAQANT